jgi:hypothetical protein
VTLRAQSKRPAQRSAATHGAVAGPASVSAMSVAKSSIGVPELISTVLTSIQNQFYIDKPREFLRDQTALMKAIARFGFTCNQNDWQFTAEEILKAIMDLLQTMKARSESIGYLPVYLQGTVDRHLRQKAEEYNERAKAKRGANFITKNFLSEVKPTEVVIPTDTEVLAKLYADLKAKRKAKIKKAPVKEQQECLL